MSALADVDLTAYRGLALETPIVPAVVGNLTGWTVPQLVIGDDVDAPAFTLTAGSGLTVTANPASVAVFLTAAQTASVTVDRLRWVLSMLDPSGNRQALARGQLWAYDAL